MTFGNVHHVRSEPPIPKAILTFVSKQKERKKNNFYDTKITNQEETKFSIRTFERRHRINCCNDVTSDEAFELCSN